MVVLRQRAVEHRNHRGGLQGKAVVTMEHPLGRHRCNALSQRRAFEQVDSVFGVVAVVYLPAHDRRPAWAQCALVAPTQCANRWLR